MGATEVKNKKKGYPRPRTNKKPKKLAFRPLGWTKNAKNWLSNPSDEQKMLKIAHRRPTKCRNR